jgi:hypothetical protein
MFRRRWAGSSATHQHDRVSNVPAGCMRFAGHQGGPIPKPYREFIAAGYAAWRGLELANVLHDAARRATRLGSWGGNFVQGWGHRLETGRRSGRGHVARPFADRNIRHRHRGACDGCDHPDRGCNPQGPDPGARGCAQGSRGGVEMRVHREAFAAGGWFCWTWPPGWRFEMQQGQISGHAVARLYGHLPMSCRRERRLRCIAKAPPAGYAGAVVAISLKPFRGN